MECILCNTEQEVNNVGLCEYCQPDTCVNCHVDDVNLVDGEFKCSHGCTYDHHTYCHRKLYTVLLNGSWREKLALAGKRIEYIIPNTDCIRIHNTVPSAADRSQGTVLGVHYSDTADELLADGKYDISKIETDTGENYPDNSIRSGSAFAWPHTPAYTEEHFEWFSDYVILEMPKNATLVSSYRFLDWTNNPDWKESIPLDKYEDQLVFTPRQLYTVCSELERPVNTNDLLLDETID